MPPLRAKMIHDMPLQRLAPRTQDAYIAAVAGLAKFYGGSPAPLHSDQMRSSLHHLLVERRRAWRAWNQGACGLKFFSVTTLGWAPPPLAPAHGTAAPATPDERRSTPAPVPPRPHPPPLGVAHDHLCCGPARRGSRAAATHRHRK